MCRSEYSALTNALRELSVYHSLLKAQLVLAQSENIIKKFLDQPSFNHWNIAVFDFILESSGISLAQKWNVPIVVNSPGLAYSPLLLPEWPFPVIGSGSNDKMHLTQRLYNSIFLIPTAYSLKVVLIVCNKVITGWSNSPTISSSLFSGAGVNYPLLINTVIGFDYSRFHSPVTHYTGPLLCRTGDITNEIPPDIAEWLESEATLDVFRGVVLISMGSTAHLTSSMIKTILNSLQTCNYSAIWSIGSTDKNLFKSALTAMPKARVKVVTWIPQSLLLQHPSVKFAILHGGINGLQEAIHNRIPIICLPQMFDQYENANRIVHNNLGLSIDPVTMNTDDLTHVVHLITYQYMFFKQSVIKLALLYDKGGGVKEAANIIEYYESVGISWIKEHNTGGLIYTVFLFTASVCLSLFFIFIFLTCYN